MKDLQNKIDAIREEFQDTRPDVVMVLDELVESRKWISAEDRLPTNKTFVLVSNGDGWDICYFTKHNGDASPKYSNRYDSSIYGFWVKEIKKITHWMPLPQPPKAGE